MKKIISLVLAMLMLCSFATISAFASDYTLTFSDARIDGDKVLVDIILSPQYTGSLMSIDITYSFPTDKLTFVKCTTTDFTGSVMVNPGLISWMDTTMAGATPSSEVLYTLEFTKAADATGSVELGFESAIVCDNDTMMEVELEAVAKTISLGGEPAATVNTLEVVGEPAAVTSSTIDGEATDYQIGSGLGMTVVAPEGVKFNKMKWAITTDAGRLFSHKTIDLPDVSGEFKVAATFINGVHENGFGITKVDAVKFSEVAAIFGFVDENDEVVVEYYTNADDANYKNK